MFDDLMYIAEMMNGYEQAGYSDMESVYELGTHLLEHGFDEDWPEDDDEF